MDESPLLLSVERTGDRLGIGRTQVFSLVRSGELKSVKIGRSRRVLASSVAEYVARLSA
jgi:excisionase family DNA binding protein